MTPWFVPMPVGHGFRPVVWQGWLALAGLVAVERLIIRGGYLRDDPAGPQPGAAALLGLAALVVFAAFARGRLGRRDG